jgi:tetratricopeptide (TPR) repeat protein
MMADARKAYEQTVRLSERQGAQRIVRLHKSTEKLSDILLHMRDYEAAAKISREFLDLAEPLLGQSDPCVAEQRASLACALAVQGKSDEADALLRASIARMDENSQWSLYMRLGNVLHTAGDWLRAKDFREHALRVSANLDIQKRHEATFSLGFTLCDLRDYQAAEHLYREFLQFAKDKLENNDRRICAERYFLAWVLHVQGRKQEAAAAYGEVSAALRNTINSGRTMWWRILDRLIYTEAVAMSTSDEASLQESVQILEEIEDEVVSDRNQNGWWYANRAVIEEKLGRKEEAIRHARLFVEHADPNSPDAHRTSREMLVRLLTEAGQHDEAEQVLRQGVEDCEQRLGDANIITNYTRADLAEYLMKHEKFAAADEPLRRAQSLVTDMRVPASQRQRIVTLLVNYCQATGNQEEAAQWRATEAITGNGAIKAEEG